MTDADASPRYSERYVVPWWFWPVGIGVALAFAAMFDGPLSTDVPVWPVYPILVALVLVGLWRIGHIRLSVTDTDLLIDDARLPLRYVAQVEALSPAARRRLLSVDAHPLAFVIQRPWIAGSVRITLDDPDDPTPYWIISSRHPERLTSAMTTADTRQQR